MKTYSYRKQNITEDDIQSVVEVLRSPYLTCGPNIKAFEQAICDYVGAKYCVAVNSATSNLSNAFMSELPVLITLSFSTKTTGE